MKPYLVLVSALALAACGSKPDEHAAADPATTPAAEGTTAEGGAPASFGQCAVCHKVEKDAPNGVGPNLHGIVGKKAGSTAGFAYSQGMKDWRQNWTEANLDKFIQNPRGTVTGTRMSFAGQSDAAKRKEIIDWLKKNS